MRGGDEGGRAGRGARADGADDGVLRAGGAVRLPVPGGRRVVRTADNGGELYERQDVAGPAAEPVSVAATGDTHRVDGRRLAALDRAGPRG